MNASQHNLSLLQLIPRNKFDELCQAWSMDKGVRRFRTWDQTCTLVLAYLMQLNSLREIEEVLLVPRSTLSDANRKRCSGFFCALCRMIIEQLSKSSANRKVKRAFRDLLVLDGSSTRVNNRLNHLPGWGIQKTNPRSAAKLTLIWNFGNEWISDFRIGAGFRHDNSVAEQLKITRGCTYVFDRGYQDLDFWWKIMSHGAQFITRLKDSKRNRESREALLKGQSNKHGVLWDGNWSPCRDSYYVNKRLPRNASFRRIIYRDPHTGKVFDFVTSDRHCSAQSIADNYKRRWAVELVFRWFKGHLNLRYLDTRNTNAIKTQIAVALLVHLLLQLQRAIQKSSLSCWQQLRAIRSTLARKSLTGSRFRSPYFLSGGPGMPSRC